ncbi:Hypothetical protein PHPALM_13891 [Phytophthora palmivora]|uniref:Integrase catalytic domain-containing protein n=1 Tax=Phytophthora palmivora TaxID=4796 RepID=A0A2P4XW70_9STRA|nr:Hypothetical protein PHPALM_13891 [Phytophthora palmivora]
MWVVDTSAGRAVTPDRSWFKGNLQPGQGHIFTYGNGTVSHSTLKGSIKLNILNPKQSLNALTLTDVSYDRECGSNLLSAYYLAEQGYRHFQSKTGEFLFFQFGDILKEWHLRLGHVGNERLIRTISNQKIEGLPNIPYSELKKVSFFCKTCAHMTDRRMSYRNMVGNIATEPLHTLHMDSTGRLKVDGLYGSFGYQYALAVVDDAIAYKWYLIVKSLKEVPGKIRTLLKQVSVQLPSYKVRRIRTDGGTEFINKVVSKLCSDLGLVFESSNVESQEENGSAERAHQSIMAGVRCALRGANMTAKWWPEALLYMTDVTNRLPMAKLGMKTPYELLHRKKSSGLALRIWGTTCYAHVPKTKRKDPKLSDRAIECKLLGLSHNFKGYRLLDVKGNKYLIARDVILNSEGTAAMIR